MSIFRLSALLLCRRIIRAIAIQLRQIYGIIQTIAQPIHCLNQVLRRAHLSQLTPKTFYMGANGILTGRRFKRPQVIDDVS